MVRPQCSYTNSDESVQCVKCATPLPLTDQTLATGVEGWSVPVQDGIVESGSPRPLSAGTVLGARYEIVRLLGQGGMGSVYQAHDRELDGSHAVRDHKSHCCKISGVETP